MPAYDLFCPDCSKEIIDKLCSFEETKNIVCECGTKMKIRPCKGGGFRIFGYSADNNYSMTSDSYDGTPNPDW